MNVIWNFYMTDTMNIIDIGAAGGLDPLFEPIKKFHKSNVSQLHNLWLLIFPVQKFQQFHFHTQLLL